MPSCPPGAETGLGMLPGAAAGRDPAVIEYTRWGQIDMTADEVKARASQGVTRLVVSPSSTERAGMRAEISSFAQRLALR